MIDLSNLRRVATGAAVTVAAVQAVTAAVGLPRGRRDYVDGAWGPGLAGVAIAAAALGNGDAGRRWALAAGVSAWATRLSTLLIPRLRDSEEEDPRYTEYLGHASTPAVIGKVFLTQGLAQLLVTLPVQFAAASSPAARSRRRALVPVGLAVMATGAVVEAVADRQKASYMARDRDRRPAVLDTGLWGWSRHPNYFGDSLFWDGVWVVAAASPPAGWTWPAPAAMNYFLIFATGARRTERRMGDRPAYQDYQRRVSFFVPLPPSS